MKKLTKVFAVTAASAMLGFFFSCSSSSEDSGPSSISGDALTAERVAVNTEAAAGTVTMNGQVYADLQEAFADIGDSGNYVIELTEGAYDMGTSTVAENGTNVKNDDAGLRYSGGANITIKGPASDNEYGSKVVIFGSGPSMDNEGGNQPGRELLEIAGSGNVILENITLYNTFVKDGDCQAEAFGFDSTGTAAAYNCSFISRQDTTRTTGKAWFYKCYVEGDVDFIWMESSGKVALYEDCRLRAVTGREKTDSKGVKKQVDAFFTAPRVNIVDEASYGKGVVLYNCDIEVETGLTTYLFRNPWGNNSAYHNNVNIVKSRLYGTVQANPMYKNAPMYDKNNPCGGFNTDIKGLSNMNEALLASEFAGRKNILNRVFDSETNSIHKDIAGEWDISALEVEFGAEEDTSLSLAAGETELVMKEIDFVNPANAMTGDVEIDTADFTVHQANYTQSIKGHGFWLAAAANSTTDVDSFIVLKNVPKYCKVTFYACAYGEGSGTVTGPNGFTSDFECKKVTACGGVGGAFVYNGGVEGDLTITFTSGNAWIHGVFIREYAELIPASKITMKASKTSIYTDQALQLSAVIDPSNVTLKAMKWSSSDPDIVYVSDKGLIQGMSVGTATITVSTKDGTGLSDSKEFTVVEKTAKPKAGKSYSWNMQGGVGCPYFSDDLLFQCFGDSDNGSHGLVMGKDSYAIIDVAGNVKVTLHRCRYDNPGICTVTDKAGNTVAVVNFPEGEGGGVADTGTLEFVYIGEATTLTLTWSQPTGYNYLHQVDVDPLKDSDITKATAIAVSAAGDKTTIEQGKTLQLSAEITPADATVTSVAWSSSDASKATVSATGLVTALEVGEVTITASAKDGSGITGTYSLEVIDPPKPVQGVIYNWDTTAGGSINSEDTFLKIFASGGNQTSGHGSHLALNNTITVRVAGACTIQLGGCQYGANSTVTVSASDGTTVGSFAWNQAAACGDLTDYVYEGSADTLTLQITEGGNTYLSAVNVLPGIEGLYSYSTTTGGNLNLDDGAVVISASGGNQTSGHGCHLALNDTITVKVGGACTIKLGGCQYGNNSTVTVLASDETTVDTFAWNKAAACGDLTSWSYTGSADTLTLKITEGGNTYLSAVKIQY